MANNRWVELQKRGYNGFQVADVSVVESCHDLLPSLQGCALKRGDESRSVKS